MRSQSKGIGSADIDASMCHKIRTIPALLHCASHWQDNARGERRATRHRHSHGKKACRVARPLHCLVRLGVPWEPRRDAPLPRPCPLVNHPTSCPCSRRYLITSSA
jgi:hypothetical protein